MDRLQQSWGRGHPKIQGGAQRLAPPSWLEVGDKQKYTVNKYLGSSIYSDSG